MLQCTYRFMHITQNTDGAQHLIIRYISVYKVVYRCWRKYDYQI